MTKGTGEEASRWQEAMGLPWGTIIRQPPEPSMEHLPSPMERSPLALKLLASDVLSDSLSCAPTG